MDKSESIVTVDDAIRKLILLNSREKIWTQEMLLQVNDKSIRLLDCESQVPRAPRQLPQGPQRVPSLLCLGGPC